MGDGTDDTVSSVTDTTDTSFGQGVIAAAQQSSPVYTADQSTVPAPTPPTPTLGTPVAGSAPGLSNLNSLFGSSVPSTYSPIPGVTLQPGRLINAASGSLSLWPPTASATTTQMETIVIVGLVLAAAYALIKL
jgi:hypothetical protein